MVETQTPQPKKKGEQKKKLKKTSSGLKHKRHARAMIRQLMMKIARWEGYAKKGKTASRNSYKNATTSNINHSRLTWNTDGLYRQIKLYEKVLKGTV